MLLVISRAASCLISSQKIISGCLSKDRHRLIDVVYCSIQKKSSGNGRIEISGSPKKFELPATKTEGLENKLFVLTVVDHDNFSFGFESFGFGL